MYFLNFCGVKNTFLLSPLYLLAQASAGCPSSPVFFERLLKKYRGRFAGRFWGSGAAGGPSLEKAEKKFAGSSEEPVSEKSPS